MALPTHVSKQTGPMSFLSQHTCQAWTQVVEVAPDQGVLNLTALLQEIATRRRRLYFIRCTLRLHAQHYHLRIAGMLPARNKMVWYHRGTNPPGYRLVSIPGLLQQATAQLRDNTVVRPLLPAGDEAFLSLSGIILTGSTPQQRYLLHEHLVNLGLAGPPAPILQWAGHLREGPEGTYSLTVLPAELLAIPVPSTSWAFEETPVMSLVEWEEYRRRTTSTVLLTTTACDTSRLPRWTAVCIRHVMPVLFALWHLGRALIVCCYQRSEQAAVLSLGNQVANRNLQQQYGTSGLLLTIAGRHPFFARVEALCVQVLHKSPESS